MALLWLSHVLSKMELSKQEVVHREQKVKAFLGEGFQNKTPHVNWLTGMSQLQCCDIPSLTSKGSRTTLETACGSPDAVLVRQTSKSLFSPMLREIFYMHLENDTTLGLVESWNLNIWGLFLCPFFVMKGNPPESKTQTHTPCFFERHPFELEFLSFHLLLLLPPLS